jgi:hypothetical protein
LHVANILGIKKKILTYSQIWLNFLMMIVVGSPISQNWGQKKKKLGYQRNEKNAKKEILIHILLDR